MQENAIDQVANGFVFGFDWLKSWRDFCRPIIERIRVKIKQSRLAFQSQISTKITKTYWSILQDSSGSESSTKQPITSLTNNSPRDSDDDFHSTREALIIIRYNSPFQDFSQLHYQTAQFSVLTRLIWSIKHGILSLAPWPYLVSLSLWYLPTSRRVVARVPHPGRGT